MKTKNIKFTATESSGEVSGILAIPDKSKSLLILAHGAGAGMDHIFMEKISGYLYDAGIGTLRYNFPYTEKKKKSPDSTPILIKTVRSAVKAAKKYTGDNPLFAGGKSMGGRMTSMAASKEPLEDVRGIIFFGFPLHAPAKPSNERAEHLFNVNYPMLFLQGTRDKLADLNLLKPIINKLSSKTALHIIEGADHSFHMPKSLGRGEEEVFKELVNETVEWMNKI